MLYKPSNPFPHNETIDISKPFNFECFVDAGVVHDYDLYLKRTNTDENFKRMYETNDLTPIYGNNGEKSFIKVSSEELADEDGILNNNDDYSWKLRMFDSSPSTLIGFGTIIERTGGKSYTSNGHVGTDDDELPDRIDLNTFGSLMKTTPSDGKIYGLYKYKVYNHPAIVGNSSINKTKGNDVDWFYDDSKEDNSDVYCLYWGYNSATLDSNTYEQSKGLRYLIKIDNYIIPIYKIEIYKDYTYLCFPYHLKIDNTYVYNIITAGTKYELYCNYLDSNEYLLKTKDTPVYTITTNTTGVGTGSAEIPKNIKSSSATFTIDTTNNSDIVKYRFIIEQKINGIWSPIDDSGNIYSSYVTYTFDRFMHNQNYRVSVTITDRDGFVGESEYYITPLYSNSMIDFVPKVVADTYKGSVLVGFNELLSIPFKQTEDSNIEFDENEYLVVSSGGGYFDEITDRDNFTIPQDFSFVIQFKILHNYSGLLYSIEDNLDNIYTIVWDGSYIKLSKNNSVFWSWTPYSTENGSLLTATAFPIDRSGESEDIVYKYIWNDDAVWDDSGVWKEYVPVEEKMYTLVYDNGTVTIEEMSEEVAVI